jgi:steroid delta-isomerase-like uncharacterized protein
MMSEQNKAVLRRHFDEVWSQGKVALVDRLFASDYIGHAAFAEMEGRERLKPHVCTVRTAFPDLQFTVEDVIAEGDRVVTHWIARGTHEGEFKGIAPTGRHIRLMGISIARVANGMIVECWTSADEFEIMRQLGVPPQVGHWEVGYGIGS